MPSCCIPGCKTRSDTLRYPLFRFPRDSGQRRTWLENIGAGDWYPTHNSRICSRHFIDGKRTDAHPFPVLHLGSGVKRKLPQALVSPEYRPNEEANSPPKKRRNRCGARPAAKYSAEAAPSPSSMPTLTLERTTGLVRNSVLEDEILASSTPPPPVLPPPRPVAIFSLHRTGELDETFTDSQSSLENVLKPPVISVAGKSPKSTPKHVALHSLDSDRRTRLLIRYKNKYRKERNLREQEEWANRVRLRWDDLIDNDALTTTWTGFPTSKILQALFNEHIQDDAALLSLKTGRRSLRVRNRGSSKQLEFLLTLVRLRANLNNTRLAYLFDISEVKVGRIIYAWIPFLAEKFRFIVDWIPREEMPQLPKSFELFPRCVAVIDGTEMQLQKPAKMAVRQSYWSEYKQRYTAKILVVMSPNGCITYVSRAVGGRTSDRTLVMSCEEFLRRLNPGEELLGDKGFDMREYFLLNHRVHLRIPAFLKKNEQFARNVVDRKRKLAHARIHVERSIGRLKKFEILSSVFPESMFKLIDDIVVICAAICNMHPPLVK